MGLRGVASSLRIAAVFLCLVGLVRGEEEAEEPACTSTGFNFKDEKCPKGWEELWKDSAVGQTNRLCCDPKHAKYKDYVNAYKATCRPTDCQAASSGGSTCASFYDRYKKGKKLQYDEILRESCQMPSGGSGVLGLCCEKDSMEGQIATTLGSEPNEFPHMAKLRLPGHCGGTVYNKKWIVTAAHCVVDDGELQDPSTAEVILGSNIGTMEDKDYIYKVKRIIPNPGYSRLSTNPEFQKGDQAMIFNDIALMELDREIKFGPHVKSLEIAPKGFNAYDYSDKGVIIGWGTTDTLEVSQHLNKANLVLRKDKTCFEADDERHGPYWNYNEYEKQLFCIGGVIEGRWSPTAGGGDSGGPAICRGKDGKILLCGVTSFGGNDTACSMGNDEENCPPSIYAEVAHFHGWIQGIAGKQDSSTFYKPYLYGEPVPKGQYPHQVHITSSDGKPCGGTLVAKNYVVTAAQCVVKSGGNKSYRGLKVITGVNDLNGKGKQFGISGVAVLPGFERVGKPVDIAKQGDRVRLTDNYFKNDLAVLKLDGDVDISPSKIPSFPESNPEDGKEIALPRPTESNPNTQMRSRDFRFLGQSECQTRMDRLARAGLNIKVDRNLLCGVEKYSGGSTCDRELGGGVICKGPGGKEQLCGVQIFRMCESAIPNGFMNMVLFKHFVKAAMEQL